MAEVRDFVWLRCKECKRKGYREERKMKTDTRKEHKMACMDDTGKLAKMKYCKDCKKHTMHNEDRRK